MNVKRPSSTRFTKDRLSPRSSNSEDRLESVGAWSEFLSSSPNARHVLGRLKAVSGRSGERGHSIHTSSYRGSLHRPPGTEPPANSNMW